MNEDKIKETKEILAMSPLFAPNVYGVSMQPFIYATDSPIITAVKGEIKKYDVVNYMNKSGAWILHRVIKVGRDSVTIIGDNNLRKEKNVPKDRIAAVMVGIYRSGDPNDYIDVNKPSYRLKVWLYYNIPSVKFIRVHLFYRKRMKVAKLERQFLAQIADDKQEVLRLAERIRLANIERSKKRRRGYSISTVKKIFRKYPPSKSFGEKNSSAPNN